MMIYLRKKTHTYIKGRGGKTGKKGKQFHCTYYLREKISFFKSGVGEKYPILDKYTPLG